MKPTKPISTRKPEKATKPKKKRNLDNSTLKPFFGKSPENIWEKDIHTSEGNFSFFMKTKLAIKAIVMKTLYIEFGQISGWGFYVCQ